MLRKGGDEIKMVWRKGIVIGTNTYLSLPFCNIIQTGKRTTNMLPVPVTVMLGKTYMKCQKMKLING